MILLVLYRNNFINNFQIHKCVVTIFNAIKLKLKLKIAIDKLAKKFDEQI